MTSSHICFTVVCGGPERIILSYSTDIKWCNNNCYVTLSHNNLDNNQKLWACKVLNNSIFENWSLSQLFVNSLGFHLHLVHGPYIWASCIWGSYTLAFPAPSYLSIFLLTIVFPAFYKKHVNLSVRYLKSCFSLYRLIEVFVYLTVNVLKWVWKVSKTSSSFPNCDWWQLIWAFLFRPLFSYLCCLDLSYIT